jgi:thiol-disulfide isomerase/thioredoxin
MLAKKRKAPDLENIEKWINSEPLSMVDLLGDLVLVDFWSYACINCRRSIPFVKRMHEKYSKDGLRILGIHSSQYLFEKDPSYVEKAVQELGIEYPVALDPEKSTWRAYGNSYWPTKYLLGEYNKISYAHFGEGSYLETENMIQNLLGTDKEPDDYGRMDYMPYQSPETYAGFVRNNGLGSGISCDNNGCDVYKDPGSHLPNTIYPEGRWKQEREYLEMLDAPARVSYKYTAREVYVVVEPLEDDVVARVSVDSQDKGSIKLQMPNLYKVYETDEYEEHDITVEFSGRVRLYAFTFG